MSSRIYSYLFILYAIGYIKKCHSHYEAYTQNRYRHMLFAMQRELIRDSLQKVRSVQFLKSYYTRSPSFHVAERIFDIRKKFARMMREYTKAYDVVGNNTEDSQHIYLQGHMVKMQRVGMDIDHLVEILTEWEDKKSKNLVNIAGFNIPMDSMKLGPGNFPGIAGISGGLSSFGGFDTPPGSPKSGGVPGPGEGPGPYDAPGSVGVFGPGGGLEPGGAHEMALPAEGPSSGGGPGGAPAPSGPARAMGSRVRAGKFGW